MTTITEADVEQAALDWLSGLGWAVASGQTLPQTRPRLSASATPRYHLVRSLA